MHSPLSRATWAVLPGRTQFIILEYAENFFHFLALTTSALSSVSAARHRWIWDRCHFAFRSVSSTHGAVFPSPWPRTHSQPRACSAFSASEGCNLLETSAMTLLLLLNSWLSCGVTWVKATNLVEPQTLKDTPWTKVAMISFTWLRFGELNSTKVPIQDKRKRWPYKHTTHHADISTY